MTEDPKDQEQQAEAPEPEDAEAADAEPEAEEGQEEPADEAEEEAAEEPEEAEEPAEEAAEEEPAEEAEEGPAVVVLAAAKKSEFGIVLPEEPAPAEEFAAQQLQHYVERICGAKIEVAKSADAAEKRILLGAAAGEDPAEAGLEADGYVVDISPERIALFGARPRSVLYAVYDLLARAGCRWPLPGDAYEHVPESGAISLELGRSVHNPRFEWRGFCEDANYVDHDDEHAKDARTLDDIEFIDWLAKNRLNHFMVRAPEDVLEVLLAEMAQRDLGHEAGGHIIPQLLPRELFEEKPELFRMSTKGEREPSGNLCASNDEAIKIVCDNALEFFKGFPQAELIHFWGDDVMDGGWCTCEQCRELLPQDQYLKVCNAVAEALGDQDVEIDYIAYHDTLEPEFNVEPADRLTLLFAPRERCYGHFLGDPTCRENQPYANALRKHVELFPGRTYIFEYYDDAILYGSLSVPLQHTIAADLSFYEQLGIKRVQSLMFGRFSWWAYPLNMYVFARLCWDAEPSVEDLTNEFCELLYAESGPPMAEYFDKLEEGIRGIATYGDIKRPWRARIPPRSISGKITECMAAFNEAKAFLDIATSRVEEDTAVWEELQKQRKLWIYTVGELEGVGLTAEGAGEAAAAARAEGELRNRYLRAAHLKLTDAAGVFGGGLELIESDVAEDVKGQWGAKGLVESSQRLIEYLESRAQQCLDAIPPEPEPEEEEEEPAEAEAAEGEAAEAEEAEAEEAEGPAEEEEPEADASAEEAEEAKEPEEAEEEAAAEEGESEAEEAQGPAEQAAEEEQE
ncbi:MAG: DUF4838 domain-containing protein [Armatimonadota bacterium]